MIEINATILAQIINFLILVIILRAVAYKPVARLLQQRSNKIKRDNILIKDCGYKKAFAGKHYVRIAVRDTADNDRLLRALRALEME